MGVGDTRGEGATKGAGQDGAPRARPVATHEFVPSRSSLQVLERTFAILALFSGERPEWTTTEIARACDLPIPTAHRILASLRAHGYVARDETSKRFRLGHAACELGERARSAADLAHVAAPVLRSVAGSTGEVALLTAVNERRDASLCVDRIESGMALHLSVRTGRELPLHAGASQKALLAFMPDADVERVLRRPLEKLCRATITDPQVLRGHLDGIRERGWAMSFEENDPGVWGVAVPIIDGRGTLAGAVGVAGPRVRLVRREISESVARLRDAAVEIACTLSTRLAQSSSAPRAVT